MEYTGIIALFTEWRATIWTVDVWILVFTGQYCIQVYMFSDTALLSIVDILSNLTDLFSNSNCY